jgi:hypothetical protein
MPIEALKDLSATEMVAALKDLQPGYEWHWIEDAIEGFDGTIQIYFIHDDVCIFDPTLSDCFRFDADPEKDYGLSPDAAMTMMLCNKILQERSQ